MAPDRPVVSRACAARWRWTAPLLAAAWPCAAFAQAPAGAQDGGAAAEAPTLTFGGQLRERLEVARNPAFGLRQPRDSALLHRLMVHAELRAGEAARAFVELGFFEQSGRDQGPTPTDVDRLDATQAFAEWSPAVGAGRLALRAGRQEMSFGASRLVSVRDGANVRRSFDALRAGWTTSAQQIDAFYSRPVRLRRGSFDDDRQDGESFWGAYRAGTAPELGASQLDAYYLGLRRERATFAGGTAREHRHTVGARLHGTAHAWDWDVEAALQFGRFGTGSIRAWTIASETGYTFAAAPLRPRVSLKADVASGDNRPADGRLRTFNALYPKLPYFSDANLVSPANIMDLHPAVELQAAAGVTVRLGWNFLWRQTPRDAAYHPTLGPLAGTAGRGSRFIGHQAIAGLDWELSPNLSVAMEYVHVERGSAIRAAGGLDVDFLKLSSTVKF